MHGFTDIPVSTYFQTATDCCTRGHTKMLVKSHCHTDARLCFFLTACYQPLEQFVSRNSRCTISKCFQETLGITVTEEDGLLHGLLVCIKVWVPMQHRAFKRDAFECESFQRKALQR